MKANVSVVTKLNVFLGLLLAAMVGLAGLGLYAGVSGLAALLLGLFVVGGSALAIYLRLAIRKGILRSIRAAARVISHVAEGDLTVKVDVASHGETQKMLSGLDAMTADLRTLVSEVASSARTVADTSAQIAQGNLDLSQRTEEQASTLEETASSMEELTSTVAHSADNAREASQLAVGASEVARKGGQVVGQVVATMTDISASSRRIGDIIGVIDGIAFQTNILALNAAVEAARAGDQGRGFAVVAAEVRNLAQRSAAAAKEIKTLINDSVHKVEAGTRLVDAAGQTMGEIVTSVKKVSDLIAEIAAASQEQSAGIGQVNTAVSQMEQVVQQNASLVEQATAATESMKDQAAALLQLVARFRLGAADGADRADAPPMPAPALRAAMPPMRGKPLPPAAAPALAGTGPRTPIKGQWEEF
ncbi:MAG: HAMP domain-containing protein [Ramlibacter sp.]|nr:HAMP domain-containing protein [Ramlibacter sp.]